jgi:hypothetical protein
MRRTLAEMRGLLDQVESRAFSAEINVFSDSRSIEQAILSRPVVRELIHLCKEDPAVVEEILERTRKLTGFAVDPNYESPWDSALATLMLVLTASGEEDSAFLAASMTMKAPYTWWAGKVSNRLLTQRQTTVETSDIYKEFSQPPLGETWSNWLAGKATNSTKPPVTENRPSLLIIDTLTGHQRWTIRRATRDFRLLPTNRVRCNNHILVGSSQFPMVSTYRHESAPIICEVA